VREEKIGIMKSIVRARDMIMESAISQEEDYAGTGRISKNKRTERLRGSIVQKIAPTVNSPVRELSQSSHSIDKFRKAHD
jgi:hypothetical protein